MIEKRVFLSASQKSIGTLRSEVEIPYSEFRRYLSAHGSELKHLVNWTLKSDSVVLEAKPEAFGILKLGDLTIEVLPKFLGQQEEIPFRFVSDLFNVTQSPKKLKGDISTYKLEGPISSAFDWYFYSTVCILFDFIRKYDRRVLHSYEEQVVGVRGRIKVAETIRAGKGLKHLNVCEIQTTRPRSEFLGIIKTILKTVSTLTQNNQIKDVARRALSFLKDVDDLPFSGESVRRLKSQSKLIISEYRKSAPVLQSIFGIFDLISSSMGSLSSVCFSFNMNTQFELVVDRLLESIAGEKKWKLESGNRTPLALLNNECSGFSIENEDNDSAEEFEADSIIIKPDAFLVDQSTVRYALDSKYKILNYEPFKQKFSGVRSKDVQQVVSYWLHFANLQKAALKVGLIYPHPQPELGTSLISKLGEIKFESPIKGHPLNIIVFGVDIIKTVEKLTGASELDQAELANLLAS